jgi:rod shape-determining protein MreC
MYKLLLFLNRNKNFFYFLFLEFIAFFLIIANNAIHQLIALNTSNFLIGNYYKKVNQLKNYFSLVTINENLAKENSYLRNQLEKYKLYIESANFNNISNHLKTFEFINAKVINNSVNLVNNYITLDKGLAQGVKPHMGIVGSEGVVGIVKNCTENFSIAYSILHTEIKVSAKHLKSKALCTFVWKGDDFKKGTILYLPRHIEVALGDTIVTSGYSQIFPEGIPIGWIEKIEIQGDESTYRIQLKLSTDFSKLNYVYILKNTLKAEYDSLQNTSLLKNE